MKQKFIATSGTKWNCKNDCFKDSKNVSTSPSAIIQITNSHNWLSLRIKEHEKKEDIKKKQYFPL